MRFKQMKAVILGMIAASFAFGMSLNAQAANLSDLLPSAGMGLTLGGNVSLSDIYEGTSDVAQEEASGIMSLEEMSAALQTPGDYATDISASSMVQLTVVTPEEGSTALSETEESVEAVKENLQNAVMTNAGTAIDFSLFFAPTRVSVTDVQLQDIQTEEETEDTEVEETEVVEEKKIERTLSPAEAAALAARAMASGDEVFTNLVIAQVNNYVNVRSLPSEEGDIVGKLYNKSVGTFISQKDGWYEINSGSVTGYVKGEYVVTGTEAVALAKEVGERVAVVTTQTLNVRKEASVDAELVGQVPMGDELSVLEEGDGWVKVSVSAGDGWVSMDYVTLKTDFVQAESKAEEEARLAREEAARAAARAASARNTSKTKVSANYNSASSYIPVGGGSATGNAVCQFALQFLGNPYVYGGTSLTNGTDCSGFVQSVYRNFGISLPRTSYADRSVGTAVGSLADAQPGDLICYSGHVALYIGGGQIVHASSPSTGIIVSSATHKKILAIRRVL